MVAVICAAKLRYSALLALSWRHRAASYTVCKIFRRIAHAVAPRHGRGSVISSLTPLRSCLAEPHNISARLTAVEAGPDLPQVQHVPGAM